MQRDAAVDLLMYRLGNRTDVAMKNKIIAEMSLAQTQILEKIRPLPWFLVTKDDTLTALTTTNEVTLPTGFLDVYDYGRLTYVNSSGYPVEITRQDYDRLNKTQDNYDALEHYDIIGETLYLFGTATTDTTLTLWYYGADTDPAGSYGVDDMTNGWLTHAADWVIAETGFIMAEDYIQDDIMAARFDKKRAKAKFGLEALITAKAEAARSRYMENE